MRGRLILFSSILFIFSLFSVYALSLTGRVIQGDITDNVAFSNHVPTCQDSDGGFYSGNFGTVTTYRFRSSSGDGGSYIVSGTYNDACMSRRNLKENYCVQGRRIVSIITCADRCDLGACTPAVTGQATTPSSITPPSSGSQEPSSSTGAQHVSGTATCLKYDTTYCSASTWTAQSPNVASASFELVYHPNGLAGQVFQSDVVFAEVTHKDVSGNLYRKTYVFNRDSTDSTRLPFTDGKVLVKGSDFIYDVRLTGLKFVASQPPSSPPATSPAAPAPPSTPPSGQGQSTTTPGTNSPTPTSPVTQPVLISVLAGRDSNGDGQPDCWIVSDSIGTSCTRLADNAGQGKTPSSSFCANATLAYYNSQAIQGRSNWLMNGTFVVQPGNAKALCMDDSSSTLLKISLLSQ